MEYFEEVKHGDDLADLGRKKISSKCLLEKSNPIFQDPLPQMF